MLLWVPPEASCGTVSDFVDSAKSVSQMIVLDIYAPDGSERIYADWRHATMTRFITPEQYDFPKDEVVQENLKIKQRGVIYNDQFTID